MNKMKGNNSKLIYLILIFGTLMFIGVFSANTGEAPTLSRIDEDTTGVQEIPQSSDHWSNFTYIHLTGANWSTAKSYGWVTGNGVWGDPYILENMTIDATNSETGKGIYIEDSMAYFEIRNCTVFNAGPSSYDCGICLYNTGNGTIINNNITNNVQGIAVTFNSHNNTIKNNNVNANLQYGIYIQDALVPGTRLPVPDTITVPNIIFKRYGEDGGLRCPRCLKAPCIGDEECRWIFVESIQMKKGIVKYRKG